MLPVFTNDFGVGRSVDGQKKTIELQLNFGLRYVEAAVQPTKDGPVTVSAQTIAPVASVLMTLGGTAALIKTLRDSLGPEFDEILEWCEAQDNAANHSAD